MRTYNYILIPAGDMSTPLASTAQPIDYSLGCSVQVVYASTGGGVPQGIFNLSGSNDGVNFVTLSNSTTAITGSGKGMWNVTSADYEFLKVNFTPIDGSSGQLKATLFSKGF